MVVRRKLKYLFQGQKMEWKKEKELHWNGKNVWRKPMKRKRNDGKKDIKKERRKEIYE